LLKKLLTSLGSIIALVSLGFVGQQLFKNWSKVGSFQLTTELIIVLLLGAVSYACACFLLSSAWYKILTSLCSESLSTQAIRSIYARSQIAKYIPGNVMQLAGRHIMISRLGIAHKPLALASLMEIIGLVSASCTFAAIGSALFGLWNKYINQQQLYYGFAIVAIVLLLLPFVRKLCLKLFPKIRLILASATFQWAFFQAYIEYLLFFAISGAILVGLVFQLNGALSLFNIAIIIATFAVSWLVGFITPGAPSGIGIRETILVVSLDKILLADNGVLIAILFRIVTIAGDLLFFSIAGKKAQK
jgi:hypothetical protein